MDGKITLHSGNLPILCRNSLPVREKKNVSSHLFTSEVAAASSRSAAVLRSSSEHMLSSWPALRGAWPTPKCSKHKTLGVCFSDLWCKLYDTANVLCMPAWWESTQSSNPKIQTQTKKHQKQTEMIEKLVPLLLPSID